MFQKVGDKKNLYDRVVQQLKRSILQGDYKCGDKFPTEKELGQIFRVSRTIIREAVKSLEAAGLIEVKHGYGIFVSDLTHISYISRIRNNKESIFQVFEIRKVLETRIAFWAATKASEDKLEEMAQIIGLTDKCIKSSKSDIPAKFEDYNKKFHMALAEATGNTALVSVMENLLKLMAENQVKSLSIPGCIICSFEEHKKILMSVRAKEPEKASKEMYNHLNNREEDISIFLKNSTFPHRKL
ncbi:MAG: FadR/GntR family transcriptional regulator [Bacillota bacterium]